MSYRVVLTLNPGKQMAWEWSHTDEAYQNAREQLNQVSDNDLRIIFGEWWAHAQRKDSGKICTFSTSDFDSEIYQEGRNLAQELQPWTLAEFIWKRMEKLRTCDNGGHRAWACPYGCDPHKVPFDPVKIK